MVPPAFAPCSILGIRPTATISEIRTAYRRCALATHPDKGGTPEKFQAVKAAYECALAKAARAAPADKKVKVRKKMDEVARRSPAVQRRPEFKTLEEEVLWELKVAARWQGTSNRPQATTGEAGVRCPERIAAMPTELLWSCLAKVTPKQREHLVLALDQQAHDRLRGFLVNKIRTTHNR